MRVFCLIVLVFLSLPASAADSTPPASVNKVNLDKAAILSWAAATASAAMTFDYINYQQQLQQSSHRFTKEGWETFMAALQKKGLVENVTKYEQTVYTHPNLLRPPTILSDESKSDVQQWAVSVPLMLQARAGNKKVSQSFTVTMTLVLASSIPCCPDLAVQHWEEVD